MTYKLDMTFETAKVICEMDEVCYGEGIGPDNDELMRRIVKEYPILVNYYVNLNRYTDEKIQVLPNDWYIEIYYNKSTFDVQVRWTGTGDQHKTYEFDTPEEVASFIIDYYAKPNLSMSVNHSLL